MMIMWELENMFLREQLSLLSTIKNPAKEWRDNFMILNRELLSIFNEVITIYNRVNNNHCYREHDQTTVINLSILMV